MNICRLIVAVLIGLTAMCASASDEDPTYLCVSEVSTGFLFEKGLWIVRQFNVSDEKYILRKIKEDESGYVDKTHPWGVFDSVNKFPIYTCFINGQSNDFICDVGRGEFKFSPKSGRFITTYTFGYWEGADNGDNSPFITRGRCSQR